mmetsp:Transcript_42782/g.126742  ORF Transcript_42782/g.126742 Transcript_42782/m.126742 type:complete len:256 (+) Transcript_42782:244-1011(+)
MNVKMTTHVVNQMAYSGIAFPMTTNWMVARDDDNQTNIAVVAWLASGAMPSSSRSGPMMMPPPMPRKPPRKPATIDMSGYIHRVSSVHSSIPSAYSPSALFLIVLAPAAVKTKQRPTKPSICIQYGPEHCGAFTRFTAKKTAQHPKMRLRFRWLSWARRAAVRKSASLIWMFCGLAGTPPGPPEPPGPLDDAAMAASAADSFLHCEMPLVQDFCSADTRVTTRMQTMSHWGLMMLHMTPRVTPAARPGFSIMITS